MTYVGGDINPNILYRTDPISKGDKYRLYDDRALKSCVFEGDTLTGCTRFCDRMDKEAGTDTTMILIEMSAVRGGKGIRIG